MDNYTIQMMNAFPYRIDCTEPEANRVVRVLLRNDGATRPGKQPHGTNYAYTTDPDRTPSGTVWLSESSLNRLLHYVERSTAQDLTVVDRVIKSWKYAREGNCT